MSNKILALIVVILIGVGAYWYMNTKAPVAPDMKPAVATTTKATTASYTPSDFSWQIKDSTTLDDGLPHQNVTLKVGDNLYPLGDFIGCNTGDTKIDTGQIVRITCFYGGAGNQIAVYKENGKYLVKKRWMQESGGPEVNAEPYGPWEVVASIK